MLITFPELIIKLKAAEKILLTTHINPDGDAIGSALATFQILRSLGKIVNICIDDTVNKNLSFLPYFKEIRQFVTNEIIDFDLLLILDTDINRIGNIRQITNVPILNIDHHISNNGKGVELYVEPEASATCEIIFELCKSFGLQLTPSISTCLYTGLATDSGFFKNSSTNSKTFFIASELVCHGANPSFIAEQLNKKTWQEFCNIIKAIQTVKFFFDGKVAGIFINESLREEVDSIEGLIDIIKVIKDTEIIFKITEREQNLCRVSLRSKRIDISKLIEKFGGGGHAHAAGCTLNTNFKNAEKIIINAISQVIDT